MKTDEKWGRMTVKNLLDITEMIAPADCVWRGDNIGLLVGHADAEVTHVLVALDVSLDVIAEAKEMGAQVIITHHPAIFDPLKTITDNDAAGRRILAMIEAGIAHIAMHTNYDGAEDGINDELAVMLGIEDAETLVNHDGEYARYGLLREALDMPVFAKQVKKALNATVIRACDAGRSVHRVCVGSGGSGKLLPKAIAAGCDTFVTGDVRHDTFCDARDMGINLIDAGHFATEDMMCAMLVRELSKLAQGIEVKKSRHSKPPFEVF